MKSSIKSQTEVKCGQKKANFVCGVAIPLSQENIRLQEYH